jgi:membrane fusion protein (multidrug efflux system)
MFGVPALFAVVGYTHYMAGQPFVSTDNAYARVAKLRSTHGFPGK